jgi:large subunit ribosomal protein L25
MMEIIQLDATRRQESGKSPSRRLRRTGNIPAVCYGKGRDTLSVAVSPKALLSVLQSAHGKNSVISLAIEGSESLTVMVRDFGYHPISRELVHADFLQVQLDQPIDTDVPLRCVGKSKGVAVGGLLQQIFRTLPIRCLPEQIPAVVEVDITELDLSETLKAGQIGLPEGVRTRLPEEQTVIVVAAPEKTEEAEAEPGAPAVVAAAAAPAPAAKADKKAGKKK